MRMEDFRYFKGMRVLKYYSIPIKYLWSIIQFLLNSTLTKFWLMTQYRQDMPSWKPKRCFFFSWYYCLLRIQENIVYIHTHTYVNMYLCVRMRVDTSGVTDPESLRVRNFSRKLGRRAERNDVSNVGMKNFGHLAVSERDNRIARDRNCSTGVAATSPFHCRS